MLPALVVTLCAQATSYQVPEGFAVEAVSGLAHSFLALTFDDSSRASDPDRCARAYLSVEQGPILWCEDRDGDGRFESDGTLCEELQSAQGLLVVGDVLFAVARRAGEDAVWRARLAPDRRSVTSIEHLVGVQPANGEAEPGEHGAHGLALGPDGELYLAIGDHARLAGESSDPFLAAPYEGALLPKLVDPNGHAVDVRAPCGGVARIELDSGRWSWFAVGLRNAYDLAFDARGVLLTFDSDMEWDVGLPWYRPPRFLELVQHGEHGSRSGSWVWPLDAPDAFPALALVERGSPTGLVIGSTQRYPLSGSVALFAADWSQGRILAMPWDGDASLLRRADSAARAQAHVLVQGQGFNPTDLALGPDALLYWISGGRGTIGRLERLVWRGADPAGVSTALELASTNIPDARQRAERWSARVALARLPGAPENTHCAKTLAAALVRERPDQVVRPIAALLFLPDFERLSDDPALALEELCALQVLLETQARAMSGSRWETLARRLIDMFPPRDARLAREVGVLLAHLRPSGAIERLLSVLESTQSQEEQIHWMHCLSAFEGGWSRDSFVRAARWFDGSRAWSGGASFQGYLEALRARVEGALPLEERAAVAETLPLPLSTLAHLASELDLARQARLATPWRYAWAGAATGRDSSEARALRANALEAWTGPVAPELASFFRQVLEDNASPRAELLVLLARAGAAEDWPIFVSGLEEDNASTVSACARALSTSERRPDGPAPFAKALAAARRLGAERGLHALELLAHWLGQESNVASDWNARLAGVERELEARFPDGDFQDAGDALRPRWSFDATLAFLERSAARRGSTARGAEVFARATCSNCHVAGDSATLAANGFGPDLSTVTARFDRRALLEALVFPSRAIADLYRTEVVETIDERRIEGRLVRSQEEEIEVALADGSREVIARTDIAARRPSSVSFMPSGLLAHLDLEEIKDLFAFLEAEGRVREPLAPLAPLFEGRARNRWEGDRELWEFDEGLLRGHATGLAVNSYLVSKDILGDFELACDVRLSAGANSGIQFASRLDPARADPIGLQADLGQGFWGSIYATDGRGLIAAADPQLWREVVDPSGWNHLHLRVERGRVTYELNGALTATAEQDSLEGVIAFQLHQGEAMELLITNARWRDLTR